MTIGLDCALSEDATDVVSVLGGIRDWEELKVDVTGLVLPVV